MVAHQAPLSLGFSRQENWSGLPFPSPMPESEKWKWSHSVMSDSSWPHGLQPTRLLHPWDFAGKSTGVGCTATLPKFLHEELEQTLTGLLAAQGCIAWDDPAAFWVLVQKGSGLGKDTHTVKISPDLLFLRALYNQESFLCSCGQQWADTSPNKCGMSFSRT